MKKAKPIIAIVNPMNLQNGRYSKVFDYVVVVIDSKEAAYMSEKLMDAFCDAPKHPFPPKNVSYSGSGTMLGGASDIGFVVRKTHVKRFLAYLKRKHGVIPS